MRTQTRLAVLILLAALVAPGVAAGDGTVVAGDLGKELDQAVQAAAGTGFWGAVLVAREGEILLAKGYGFADYEEAPNSPETLFELASASKQIAAAAILHLEQRKKLRLSDSIGRFFENLPEDKKAITVHHLLTHTAGLSGDLGVPYASRIGRAEYVKKMLSPPLASAPGEKFAYSNVGYALLAAIVEEITGRTFEEYCERHLFKPAGMKDTGFIGDRDLIRTGRASVRRTKEPGKWTAADWHWGWGYKGMGGVVTTVLDLHRWDRALRGDRILDGESRTALFAPAKAGYAGGWRVDVTDRGTRKAHHSGGVAGYATNVVRFLDEDAFYCVLSNDGRAAFAASGAIERLLFPPPRLTATIDVTSYEVGSPPILKLPDSVTWEASRTDGGLAFRLKDGAHTLVEIGAPGAYGNKLIASLGQAIAAREADDDGGPARTEAGLYLQPYPSLFPRFTLDEGLTLDIRPEYRGRNPDGSVMIDRRVMLVLMDAKYGQWPLLAHLNVAAARALLTVLKETTR